MKATIALNYVSLKPENEEEDESDPNNPKRK